MKTPDVPLTDATRDRVDALFAPQDRAEAARLLAADCAHLPLLETAGPRELERYRYAALKISNGDLKKLRAAVALARLDWRDLLMAADFGRDPHAHERWNPPGIRWPEAPSAPAGVERREVRRFIVPVEVRAPEGFAVLDVSLGGMRVESSAHYDAKAQIPLQLVLPNGEPLAATGVVLWVRESESPARWNLGIRLLPLPPHDARRWRAALGE